MTPRGCLGVASSQSSALTARRHSFRVAAPFYSAFAPCLSALAEAASELQSEAASVGSLRLYAEAPPAFGPLFPETAGAAPIARRSIGVRARLTAPSGHRLDRQLGKSIEGQSHEDQMDSGRRKAARRGLECRLQFRRARREIPHKPKGDPCEGRAAAPRRWRTAVEQQRPHRTAGR